MNYIGIYQIENTEKGKVYIGSSCDVRRRKIEHFSLLRNNRHSNEYLQKAWNKYGEQSFTFTVIEICELDELLTREQFYLDGTQSYNSNIGYNLAKNAAQSCQNQIAVLQLDYITFEVLDQFDSMQQAEILLNGPESWYRDDIGACIRKSQESAHGFRWCRVGEDVAALKSQAIWHPCPVQQIDVSSGKVIHTYRSIKEANIQNAKHPDNHTIRNSVKSGKVGALQSHWRLYDPNNKDPYLFVGIDVGKDGAIVVIDSKHDRIWKTTIPLIGKEYDIRALFQYMEAHAPFIKHAVLEDVHAPQMAGRSSCFEFGRGKGLLEMMLFALKIPHTQVQAKAWQKETWEGVKKQYKPGIKPTIDTKLTSILAAKSLFPSQDLTKSSRAQEPHTGIVDALLMAEFCRRKFR